MASPQIENGHTQIANEIIEALMRINLSAYESRVLWCIIRKTYGFKKKTDWIALSQFAKNTGLDRRLVHRALKKLSSKEMIVIYKDDSNKVRYGFQKNYEKWIVSSKKMTTLKLSSKEMMEVSSKEIPTKETITKESNNICPHQKIINLWHEVLPELPGVKKWSKARQGKLNARWKENKKRQNLEYWKSLFEYIRGSDFLMGKVNDFRASLPWIISEEKFSRVIEGFYENRG